MMITCLGIFLSDRRKINSDPELKAALNNEMVRLYDHKSFIWGFGAALATSMLVMILQRWVMPEMTVHTACMTIFFTTSLVGSIVRVIYYKIRG
jgi:hypothetical protein